MSQTARVIRIQQMLRDRKRVSKASFLKELEISEAQFKRDLDLLRDQFQKRISYEAKTRSYYLDETDSGPDIQLAGPMYTAAEIHALLLMQDLIAQLHPGLLNEHLAPMSERLKLLLGSPDLPSEEIRRRIRILHMASRPVEPRYFRAVSQATLARRRLHIRYFSRSSDETTERDISPQRLVFYRGNWYLDSWCHLRQGLRSFAVDAVSSAEMLGEAAYEIEEETLDQHLGSGYGIFAGPATQEAVLRFQPEAARWIAREIWHSRQQRRIEATGHLILTIPYGEERELLMDILRYGQAVEVIAPESLRELVKLELAKAISRY